MKHALIIGRDRTAAEEIENRLWNAGYRSLIHALNRQEAWAILPSIKPSLIVLISGATQNISSDELYRMSGMAETPVLVATGDPARALACLGDGVSLDGPYPMEQLHEAEIAAVGSERALAHAA